MELPSYDECRSIIETSPVAIFLCDARGIRYANGACAALLGYPDAPSVCALDPLADLTTPADERDWRQALERLLRGESHWEQVWPRVRRRDGSAFDAHVRAQHVPHPDGSHAFVTLVDVSVERRAALQAGRLARAVDLVSEAVSVADNDGLVVYANRALGALLGTSADALIGVSTLSFLADRHAAEGVIDGLRQLGPNEHACVRVELQGLTGRRFPAEVSATVFPEPDAGHRMGIVIVRDLTEAQRLERERELRERQLGSMLREAHHRIKNTLQVASDILALQAGTEAPAVREALGAAAQRIRALAAVHEGIRADQEVTEVQAGPLIHAVLRDLEGSGGGSGSETSYEVTVEDCPVTSRAASALALITAELVSNALRHAAPGTVRIWFWATGGEAALEVRDDGRHPPRVAGEGGFGLKLVRLLAEEQLRGEFALRREDAWTVARVRFPLGPGSD